MTSTPDVPHRLELEFEVPGSPEQVWDAIATPGGIGSWFIQTELEERVGGVIRIVMGDEGDSVGTVTGWDRPHRFAYIEPDWAALGDHEGAAVTPLASEFIVEARSGGSCVVRVVSSAFGTGAEWEREFFTEMERGWVPFFDNLRLYLAHFPGQHATTLRTSAEVPGTTHEALAAVRQGLGVESSGDRFEQHGLTGELARSTDVSVLVRVTGGEQGYVMFWAYDQKTGSSRVGMEGYFFSANAAAYVEGNRTAWTDWLRSLEAVPSATPAR
jgi:uncharacterized protein YndB with AHSA1/START domain